MPRDMHPDSLMPGESFPTEAPLAGEPDGHRYGRALGAARRPEGVIRAKRTAIPMGQDPGRAIPGQAGTGRLDPRYRALPAPVIWGAIWGVIQAASPLAFWWLEPRTVYALGLPLIGAVYIGFSVADGRWKVVAAESTVAGFFVIVAAISVTGSAWLLVLGLAGHGLK